MTQPRAQGLAIPAQGILIEFERVGKKFPPNCSIRGTESGKLDDSATLLCRVFWNLLLVLILDERVFARVRLQHLRVGEAIADVDIRQQVDRL